MTPEDPLPIPPTGLPPEEQQRQAQSLQGADFSGLPDLVGGLAEGVGEAASAGAEAAGEVAGAAGEAVGAVAEGLSGCSCSVAVLLMLCLSAGSALAVTFLR